MHILQAKCIFCIKIYFLDKSKTLVIQEDDDLETYQQPNYSFQFQGIQADLSNIVHLRLGEILIELFQVLKILQTLEQQTDEDT
jgi:hypothetical protein